VESGKRESILLAAAQAFSRLGFRKTSIGDIAQAAGVAKGTIYLAAKSKEDLFYQAVLRDLREWLASLARLIDPRRRADELLESLAVASVEYFESHPLVRDLFLGACYGHLPGWEERLDELRELGKGHVVQVLSLGIRQGHFRRDLEVDDVAMILQDFMHAVYVVQAHSRKLDGAEIRRRMKIGLRLVVDGLRAR
jgi:TetR/AcrR family transcriptional regulator, fatty acid metabolism regulator protein